MTKSIEQILEPKPEARPRVYAYSIDDKAHELVGMAVKTSKRINSAKGRRLK